MQTCRAPVWAGQVAAIARQRHALDGGRHGAHRVASWPMLSALPDLFDRLLPRAQQAAGAA
jgi:hypothetical protein